MRASSKFFDKVTGKRDVDLSDLFSLSFFLNSFPELLRNSSLVHRLFHKSDILVLFEENA
ncbi:hypothetical protein SAMN04487833_11360 [Sarcina sp. DSM 11001]|nr:hypothetical protein SAMN04487833_11360 [Sarcina sp. DSM 11001]